MKRNGRRPDNGNDREKTLPDRLVEVDLLKASAIIAVILIHTLSTQRLLEIGAPYHIWHAVPLFILVAGYTGAYAYLRRGWKSLGACYNPWLIGRRMRRILEPFTVMWIFQILVIVILSGWIFTPVSLVQNLILGGNGPGSFFIPVIVQHILIVPLLFLLAIRYPRGMLITAFVLDIFFEIILSLYGIQPAVYSVLYVRYLFAGALGVYLAISVPRFSRWTTAGGIIGFIYLTLVAYTRWFIGILETDISAAISHAPAYFWTLVLAVTGFVLFPKKAATTGVRILENLGKASWHIFLVQMTFFYFLWQSIRVNILSPVEMFFPQSINFLAVPAGVAITLAICCSAGYIWYISGQYLGKMLKRSSQNLV